MDEFEISRQLRHAWNPFFARFGRLTPAQRDTIPHILAGRNVVLASPTASGKTEAIVAPLAELCRRNAWYGMAVVYVAPTRALVNDTVARIAEPLNDMGISCELKHGDKPRLPKELPDWLVTTPESLDSILCRRSAALGDLRAVVIDEAHLTDGTYRGDQVRVLLRRAASATGADRLHVHLLSATLSNADEVGSRYTTDFEVVKVGGQRRLDVTYIQNVGELSAVLTAHRWQKHLCFCNRRRTVEETAALLARTLHGFQVVGHHGSLSRREREEAEGVMKTEARAVCVATSTLEIGIDIGDIDAVVLVDPPLSVSSLLQRVGRGNRRTSVTRAVAVAETSEQRSLLSNMIDVASSGDLPVEKYRPTLSVVVQQIFSLLYQNSSGMMIPDLYDSVLPLCAEETLHIIVRHLLDEGWVMRRRDHVAASTSVMDLARKGQIHSNIPDTTERGVVDVTTQQRVGDVSGVPDGVFLLARRAWQVVQETHNTLYVRPFRGQAAAPHFQRRRGAARYDSFLPQGVATDIDNE